MLPSSRIYQYVTDNYWNMSKLELRAIIAELVYEASAELGAAGEETVFEQVIKTLAEEYEIIIPNPEEAKTE
jgi:hydroxymethylpyrimidine/phosphomethylpyrimidine kinase